jgi:anti-sigma regulatory factor (Ser/Thr protein kinase)
MAVTTLIPPVKSGELEHAVTLQQSTLTAVLRLDASRRADALARFGGPASAAGGSRMFAGHLDQVREVRAFVRDAFGGHAACADAVLIASELTANAIAHSASGHSAGVFMVHLSELSDSHVAVIVTDQGGPDQPQERHAGPDAENGRGLLVVRALAAVVEFFESGGLRSVLAVVGSAGDAGGRP